MQNKFYTYVLYSSFYDKIYIGFSSNVNKRLDSHNSDINRGWTKKYKPWKLVHCEEFSTKREAMSREKELKSYQGREYIRNEILTKI
jgi:putative endonuclease